MMVLPVMASARPSVAPLVPKTTVVALLRHPSQLDLQPHRFHLDPQLLPQEELSANLPVSVSQEAVPLTNTNQGMVPVATLVSLVVPLLLSLPQVSATLTLSSTTQ